MDFNSKNFRYVTETFGNMMKRIQSGAPLYLRSLSVTHPTEQPAKLEQDFPNLSKDFSLPETLKFVSEHEFSSILRISGRVNMWLHYDVSIKVRIFCFRGVADQEYLGHGQRLCTNSRLEKNDTISTGGCFKVGICPGGI